MSKAGIATHYAYVLVRIDLPLADQLVQVGHACLEAGRLFVQPAEGCHLVLLSVRSQAQLHDALREANTAGVRTFTFHEPDDDLGDTAACTEPITGIHRPIFRRLRLWTREDLSETIPE